MSCCNPTNPPARLSASAQAACRCNRQQALRNRALFEAGALPGLRGEAASASACGSTTPTLTGELYASAAASSARTEACCDESCGCRNFEAARRNGYWPAFCHPRWLSCNELYNNRRLP